MIDFSQMAERAVVRYGYFLDILRSQADVAFRRPGIDMSRGREQAVSTASEAARSFLATEQGQLNDDTAEVFRHAHSAALSDLGLSDETVEDRFAEYIFSAAAYVTRIIAGQVERDVMAMAQHIQNLQLRQDLYVRSGRHSLVSAQAAIMNETSSSPTFRFLDRMGRNFKATKHIRDIYRQHLMNVWREVYMDVVASHGWEIVRVTHPDANFKWQGVPLIISGADPEEEFDLYYDVRDEIFHPSSQAGITIKYEAED